MRKYLTLLGAAAISTLRTVNPASAAATAAGTSAHSTAVKVGFSSSRRSSSGASMCSWRHEQRADDGADRTVVGLAGLGLVRCFLRHGRP